MKDCAAKVPASEFFRHLLRFSSKSGEQMPASNAVRNLGTFFRTVPRNETRRAVPARWAIQMPDGKIVPGTRSESADMAWDKACWPSYTQSHFEADGWKAVKL